MKPMTAKTYLSMILLLNLLVCGLHVTRAQETISNRCVLNNDCGSCFRSSGDCAFCEDPDFKSADGIDYPRCNYATTLEKLGCKTRMNYQGSHTRDEDEGFTTFRQVSPQKMTLNLRTGQTERFKIKVKPSKEFPVDLYYLMDMSVSMEDDLNNLRKLGGKIADEIGAISPNYRLAFGTFVDKTVSPFIQPAKLEEPCQLQFENKSCVRTFGYHHVFDFNGDKDQFQDYINKQNISGNLDSTEGGFDALLQVAACNTTINWSPVGRAHRIVVFVTDDSSHIAGDGKVGGIVTPNDGSCHLQTSSDDSKTKFYTETNNQDYPSVSKLKSKLQENGVIPIFAVTDNVQKLYKKLVSEWKDLNAAIGVLEGDSSNIVELIRKTYSQIITTIRLSDNSPLDISVQYKADDSCPNIIEKGAGCSNITSGETYAFDVLVTASGCPKDVYQIPSRSFVIKIPGIGAIDVDVNVQCQCPCEKVDLSKVNSTSCNGSGTFQCGICYCPPGRFGEQCQCTKASEADDALCRPVNSTDTGVVCSGSGSCVCGSCVCNKRTNVNEVISGKYCECNNYSCDRFNAELCGGAKRGTCECGKCNCLDGFLGDNCGQVNCIVAQKNCIYPETGEICSGENGKCECDICLCNKGYGGKYCQTCQSCPTKCAEYKDCIQCVLNGDGPLVESNCTSCAYLNIDVVEYEIQGICRFQIDENCFFEYDFTQSGNDSIVVRKSCVTVATEKAIPILYIVLGIIAGLVLLAFMMLVAWKIIVTTYDNYEYQKFLKNTKPEFNSKNENALYKAPQMVYDNPTYKTNPYE